ncbi:MAG: hypothetical protein J6333_03725 [Planctomycetes bacterium]|nr:hypothetical protein [Planctomycetota bacterium]
MATLLHNTAFLMFIWCLIVAICFMLGGLWLAYMIKLAVSEDEIMEKYRRQRRISEEIMHVDHS